MVPFCSMVFSVFFYNKITPAIGGGAPVPVELLITSDNYESMEKMDFSFDTTTGYYKAYFLKETEDFFYILPSLQEPTNRALALQKKIVTAVRFKEKAGIPIFGAFFKK